MAECDIQKFISVTTVYHMKNLAFLFLFGQCQKESHSRRATNKKRKMKHQQRWQKIKAKKREIRKEIIKKHLKTKSLWRKSTGL